MSQIIHSLTQKGAPFEFVEVNINNNVCRMFQNTPQYLSQVYQQMDSHAHKVLAVYQQQHFTYADIKTRAAFLARYLQQNTQIKAGAKIAIAMRNCPEWIISFIAVTSLGAIAVLINSKGTNDEITYCLDLTDCELVLVDEFMRDTAQSDLLDINIVELLAQQTFSEEIPLLAIPRDAESTAMILFTSGTTGRPKAAKLSHRGVLTALMTNQYASAIIGAQMAQKYNLDLEVLVKHAPQPATLLMFPLFHVSGCQAVFLTNLIQGGKIVLMHKWDVKQALALIQSEKITTFPGVPMMYWDIVQEKTLKDYDLSSLSSLSVAGQSTPISLLKSIKTMFPNTIIGCGYGMTETNGAIAVAIGDDLLAAPEAAGHAVATTKIKLIKEDGTLAKNGEKGEITVCGPTVMLGYDNQPEADESSFIDGWLKTGDIGYFDEQQRLVIVDRQSEMIISAGENIYCAEVERVLAQTDSVLEVVTFGVDDDRLGERVVAVVRVRPGASITAQNILDDSKNKLAKYKLPTEIKIITNDCFPKNQSGKIIKKMVRQQFLELAFD